MHMGEHSPVTVYKVQTYTELFWRDIAFEETLHKCITWATYEQMFSFAPALALLTISTLQC